MSEWTLRSRRVVTPEGVRPAEVRVREGRIVALSEPGGSGGALDVGDRVVMPALVDCHVHVNEPGRTEWEGFETATRAAAAGGIGTIVDMPLNSRPPTVTRDALAVKAAAASRRCSVDYAFWGGVVPGNARELEPMIDAGVRGFKCFLVHSGVDEFPNVGERELREAMPILARRGAVLLVHAESPGPIAAARPAGSPRAYAHYLQSRPRAAENEAIELMIRLSREFKCRVHIVHLSSSDAIETIAAARRLGIAVTAETCPHYLTFAAEEIPDGQTAYKCAPPIREAENRERLWNALGEDQIDFVVSDHSPCPGEMKRLTEGDFARAWGGISSVQFGLSAVWTGARARGYSLERVARWMCEAPARFAGLGDRKGVLAPGRDADIVVWNPEASFVVEKVYHRHPLTPYAGRTLYGVVETTFVRGTKVFDRGQFPAGAIGKSV